MTKVSKLMCNSLIRFAQQRDGEREDKRQNIRYSFCMYEFNACLHIWQNNGIEGNKNKEENYFILCVDCENCIRFHLFY